MFELASAVADKPCEILDPVTGELHSPENVDLLLTVFQHLDHLAQRVDDAKDKIRLALRSVGDEQMVPRRKGSRRSAGESCTVAQKAELKRLRATLTLSEQQWRELLELHGVQTAHDLSVAQASELQRLLQLRCRRLHSASAAAQMEPHTPLTAVVHSAHQ